MRNVGIVIGHNAVAKGAYFASIKQNEFDYYKDVANLLTQAWNEKYFNSDIPRDEVLNLVFFEREYCGSYTKEMKKLVRDIHDKAESMKQDFDLIIELHFNASDSPSANGTEVLAYEKSSKGILYAKMFNNVMVADFGQYKRGVKLIKSANERGGFGIMKCRYPYILIEPFFCTNATDAERFRNKSKLANSILDFIEEAL